MNTKKRTRSRWFWLLLFGMAMSLYAQKPHTGIGNVRLEIRQSEKPGGVGVRAVFLSWDRNPQVSEYFIESTIDMKNWTPVTSFTSTALGTPGPNGRYTAEVENVVGKSKFYRMHGTTDAMTVVPVPATQSVSVQ